MFAFTLVVDGQAYEVTTCYDDRLFVYRAGGVSWTISREEAANLQVEETRNRAMRELAYVIVTNEQAKQQLESARKSYAWVVWDEVRADDDDRMESARHSGVRQDDHLRRNALPRSKQAASPR